MWELFLKVKAKQLWQHKNDEITVRLIKFKYYWGSSKEGKLNLRFKL